MVSLAATLQKTVAEYGILSRYPSIKIRIFFKARLGVTLNNKKL